MLNRLRRVQPPAAPQSDADLLRSVNDETPEWAKVTRLQACVNLVALLAIIAFLLWVVSYAGF